MGTYSRIFAALDAGETRCYVAERAMDIAHAENACLLLGHVIEVPPCETGNMDVVSQQEEERQRIWTLVESIRVGMKEACISRIEVEVCFGYAIGALDKQLIKPFCPDLIVCGRRNLTNVRYAVTGSVSKHLVSHSHCDVLVVKEKGRGNIPRKSDD